MHFNPLSDYKDYDSPYLMWRWCINGDSIYIHPPFAVAYREGRIFLKALGDHSQNSALRISEAIPAKAINRLRREEGEAGGKDGAFL